MSSLKAQTLRFSIYLSIIVCMRISAVHTFAISQSGSRVKLFYNSKRFNEQVFIEAKDNTILFCSTKNCGASSSFFTTLNFDSWQEYTQLGFPIATSNHYEQIHSLQGFHNFVVDVNSKKDHSLLCEKKTFMDTNSLCKGLAFTGRVCPKQGVSVNSDWPTAISVLSVGVDVTVLKQESSFQFRNTPEYSLELLPLDIVIQLNVKGWNFCNLRHVQCPVSLDEFATTYLIFNLDFRVDNARPRLTEETNYFKKFSWGPKSCLFLGKFYQRIVPAQLYYSTTPSYQNDSPFFDPNLGDIHFLMSGVPQNASKPTWIKQAPGFPYADFNSKFSFFMQQTENLYDETVFEMVYRPDSACE